MTSIVNLLDTPPSKPSNNSSKQNQSSLTSPSPVSSSSKNFSNNTKYDRLSISQLLTTPQPQSKHHYSPPSPSSYHPQISIHPPSVSPQLQTPSSFSSSASSSTNELHTLRAAAYSSPNMPSGLDHNISTPSVNTFAVSNNNNNNNNLGNNNKMNSSYPSYPSPESSKNSPFNNRNILNSDPTFTPNNSHNNFNTTSQNIRENIQQNTFNENNTEHTTNKHLPFSSILNASANNSEASLNASGYHSKTILDSNSNLYSCKHNKDIHTDAHNSSANTLISNNNNSISNNNSSKYSNKENSKHYFNVALGKSDFTDKTTITLKDKPFNPSLESINQQQQKQFQNGQPDINSTNQTMSTPANATKSPSLENGEKKKRGRPRKYPIQDTKPKRVGMRGRPRSETSLRARKEARKLAKNSPSIDQPTTFPQQNLPPLTPLTVTALDSEPKLDTSSSSSTNRTSMSIKSLLGSTEATDSEKETDAEDNGSLSSFKIISKPNNPLQVPTASTIDNMDEDSGNETEDNKGFQNLVPQVPPLANDTKVVTTDPVPSNSQTPQASIQQQKRKLSEQLSNSSKKTKTMKAKQTSPQNAVSKQIKTEVSIKSEEAEEALTSVPVEQAANSDSVSRSSTPNSALNSKRKKNGTLSGSSNKRTGPASKNGKSKNRDYDSDDDNDKNRNKKNNGSHNNNNNNNNNNSGSDGEGDDDNEEGGQELYCICRKPDIGVWMIACDVCDGWFHGTCVGLTEEDSKRFVKYACPTCESKGRGKSTYKPKCRLPGCNKPVENYEASEEDAEEEGETETENGPPEVSTPHSNFSGRDGTPSSSANKDGDHGHSIKQENGTEADTSNKQRKVRYVVKKHKSKYCCKEHGLKFFKMVLEEQLPKHRQVNALVPTASQLAALVKKCANVEQFHKLGENLPLSAISGQPNSATVVASITPVSIMFSNATESTPQPPSVSKSGNKKSSKTGSKSNSKSSKQSTPTVPSTPIQADAPIENASSNTNSAIVISFTKEDVENMNEEDEVLFNTSLSKREKALKQLEFIDLKSKFLKLVADSTKKVCELVAEKAGVKKKDVCGFDTRLIWEEEDWEENSLSLKEISAASSLLESTPKIKDEDDDVTMKDSVDASEIPSTICTVDKRKCNRHSGWLYIYSEEIATKTKQAQTEVFQCEQDLYFLRQRLRIRYKLEPKPQASSTSKPKTKASSTLTKRQTKPAEPAVSKTKISALLQS